VPGSSDDERAYSRRYTDDGINVVALDRQGRGLHRARPERRIHSDRFPAIPRPSPSLLPSLIFGALVLVALGVVLARYLA
jgi:hypothetical protein